MSVQPIVKSPAELADATLKDFKGKFFKQIKKLAMKHNSAESAVPFFMNVATKYQDSPNGFLMVFGKMKAWQKFAKDNATKLEAMRGYCYAVLDTKSGSYKLFLMPIAGKIKAKENLVKKEMRAIVPAAKLDVTILFDKEYVDDPTLDEKVETFPDVEDLPETETVTDGVAQDDLLVAEAADEQAEELLEKNSELQDTAKDVDALSGVKKVQQEAQQLGKRLKEIKESIVAAQITPEKAVAKLKDLKNDLMELGNDLTNDEHRKQVKALRDKMSTDINELNNYVDKKMRAMYESKESLRETLKQRMKANGYSEATMIIEWQNAIAAMKLDEKMNQLQALYTSI